MKSKLNKKEDKVLVVIGLCLGLNYLDYEPTSGSEFDKILKMDIDDLRGIIQQLAAETEGYLK